MRKMIQQSNSRRNFLGSLAALGGASLIGLQPANSQDRRMHPISTREHRYLIKGAYILSMDSGIGDIPFGDILIEDGKISAVEKNISLKGPTVIQAKGMIALPGFIETHWHTWTSLMRAMPGHDAGEDYFSMSIRYGKLYSPMDMYNSSRLALAEAINSGITHVHDWNHNIMSPDHALESIRALKESGIRSRFSLGTASGAKNIDLNLLERLAEDWKYNNMNGRISFGLAWPGIENDRPAGKTELLRSRELGLPISVHAGRRKDRSDSVSLIAKEGLLGPDMQIVHGIDTTPKEYAAIARSGAKVSASPFSELRIGYGITPAMEMLSSGATLGFSVDTMPLTGNADMFAIMKIFLNLADGLDRNEFAVGAKRVLEIATIEGARSMGIDSETGSLVPGKKADLQLINTNAINMGVFTDPYQMVTLAGQPANVHTVMVDGKILKQNGLLTYADSRQIISQAISSLAEIQQRAKG